METLLVLYHFSIAGDHAAFESAYHEQKALQEQMPGHLSEMRV